MSNTAPDSTALVTRRVKGFTVIELPDRLVNLGDIERLSTVLLEQVDLLRPPNLIFSFKHVKHMSSSFLGKLISLHKRTTSRGGKLLLADLDDSLYDVLALTRLNKQIPTFRKLNDAVSSLPPIWVLATAGGIAATVIVVLLVWALT